MWQCIAGSSLEFWSKHEEIAFDVFSLTFGSSFCWSIGFKRTAHRRAEASNILKDAASLISVTVVSDAQPSESETAVWDKVNQVLMEAQVILKDLQTYRGAGEEIRQVNLQLLR